MRLTAATRLVIGGAAVAVIWGGALPALLRWRCVARHVASMEERGVNPSAMYYTELERLPARPAWLGTQVTFWP
jgi:hypothetical protein